MDASRGDNAEDGGGGRMHEEDDVACTPSNNSAYPNIMETGKKQHWCTYIIKLKIGKLPGLFR